MNFVRSCIIGKISPFVLVAMLLIGLVGSPAPIWGKDNVVQLKYFEEKVRPLLVKHCYRCHNEDISEGNLRLDTKNGWERGGERGPAIVPSDPAASLLIRVVSRRDDKLKMPPKDSAKLSNAEIDVLTTWIRQGAFDPRVGVQIVTDIEKVAAKHWAFQPINPPKVPAKGHPIDALIDARLQEQQIVPTEPADMPTLVRRATYDLIGLPPTEQQLATPREKFLDLVRELLASPRHGERWARHWLDVARYSDAKDGVLMYGSARIRPFAYTYRDYVIRAFNDDKPFDRFIREQLAADQLGLPEDSPDLAAMGFLTLGRMFDSNRHDVIDDQIDVVGRGFLGLTVSCARCHDHKYDPIPTADYYSLHGVFANSIEPDDRPRIGPITDAGKPFEQEFAAKRKEIHLKQQEHYQATLKTARDRTPDYLVHVATTEPDNTETTIFFLSLTPDQLRPQITKRWRQLIARRAFPEDPIFGPWHDLMRDFRLQPKQWQERGIDQRVIDGLVAAKPGTQAEVASAYGKIILAAYNQKMGENDPLARLLISRDGPVWFPARDVGFYLSRQPADAYRGLVGQLDAIAVKHANAPARAMILQDAEFLYDPVIFQRGDPNARGNPVPRQFLKILSSGDRTPFPNGSGRRDLAEAIASPTNPLTARVWVNRVWQHHFGEPLVENPSDFGLQSAKPVQMDLLDYLADFFIRSGWKTKPLHELIMTSRAYQRSSILPETMQMANQRRKDPTNRYLWYGNRRRLDLEQMRDALLLVAGQLDETMYGRPVLINNPTTFRRTIYCFVERQNIPAVVQTFDFANPDTSTARRSQTTVPQQALFALNSPMVLALTISVAKRIGPGEPAQQVEKLFQLIYGRKPTAPELQDCTEFLKAGKLEQLAQVLLMSNEFMFVD
ncbi:MAG: PSD1 and planctomycete cytochrome C domain-containing protein [Zavarzinella sp.]